MKRTFRSIATLSLASLVIVSCSPLNKMKKRAGEMGYKVTPEVLEDTTFYWEYKKGYLYRSDSFRGCHENFGSCGRY